MAYRFGNGSGNATGNEGVILVIHTQEESED
jgi:hypothetical protein